MKGKHYIELTLTDLQEMAEELMNDIASGKVFTEAMEPQDVVGDGTPEPQDVVEEPPQMDFWPLPTDYGWLCPRCGASNAPTSRICGHCAPPYLVM